MKWITKNFIIDLLFIIFPGLFCFLVANQFSDNTNILFILISIVLITDTSHIYSTFFRTIFSKKEFKRSKKLYIFLPIIIFLISLFLFIYLKINFFWSILIYASIFHQIRQNVGISKWYSKVNNNQLNKKNIFLIYTLITLPPIIFHFRPFNEISHIFLYKPNDILINSNDLIYQILLAIYLLLFLFFIVQECFLTFKNKGYTRFLFNLVLVTTQGLSFIKGSNIYEVLLPPLFLHGLSYMTVNYFAVNKINQNLIFNFLKNKLIILLFPIIIGLLLFLFDEKIPEPSSGIMNSIIFSLYILPIVCHHIWDAFIWKKSHPESKDIYN